ncbi:hypothetical protein [Paenibacillus shenyangensis]|uniref:hypothetical protein n=1 Tax=Paenibacillus sp. A9 TaxID=1284352 RepID=UPI0003728C16|nr:hypothetical protein [Paenibacillus sp. A9]
MNDYEYETQGERTEQRTLHTVSALEWMKEMRNPQFGELSKGETAFLDGLEMRIARGDFYVSSHELGNAELLLQPIDEWVSKWDQANDPATGNFDPGLERVLEDFREYDEFSAFEHVVDMDTCSHCGKENRDVKTFMDEHENIHRECYYGCDDPRSGAQGEEFDAWEEGE